jgi:hypothetical protein
MRGAFPAALTTALLVTTVVPAGASAGRAGDDLETVVSAITAEGIRRHAVVLASDGLEGRAPGTLGGERAAGYLAAQLGAIGVAGRGERGSFFQLVPLHGDVVLPTSSLVLTSPGESWAPDLGDDYLVATTGAQTLIPQPVPVVFVGYGVVAPEFDYSDYREVDVDGAVVAYLAGEPPSDDPGFFGGEQPTVYSAPETKRRIALSRGAVGSILIPSLEESRSAWDRLRRDYAGEQLSLPYDVPSHLGLVFRPRLARRLLERALYDADQVAAMVAHRAVRSFYLPVRLSFEGRFASRDVLAANLVGEVAGSGGAAMASTAVVVSAHYDHLGLGEEVDGDRVYNGLVDNALGVACVVEIARALRQLEAPPRRSVVVLLTTAEEEGMLGARYFLDHPPLPVSAMVADVNVDGLAVHALFDDVIAIGGELSDLGRMADRAAEALGLVVSDPPAALWSHESYGRSDQLAFAEAGVPAILLNEGFSWRGVARDAAVAAQLEWMRTVYHTPRDDLDQPVSWDACAQHCRAVAALVLEVASAPVAPEWRPGVRYAYERALSRARDRRE